VSLDQDVRRVEDRTKLRLVVNRDRRTGESPLVIVQVGDIRWVWAGTGAVAAGASSTVYLTFNGQAGGETLFKRAPLVQVWRDLSVTAGGTATASGPMAIGQDWSMGTRHDEHDVDLLYLGQIKAFTVKVTNLGAAEQNFVVVAQGVS
jgi:hypothetical protein